MEEFAEVPGEEAKLATQRAAKSLGERVLTEAHRKGHVELALV